jgi:hypothetical protein
VALQCLPGTELVLTLMGGLTSLVKGDRKLRLAKAPQDCMHFISSALASETQWRPASWVPARGDAIGNCGSNSKPRNCEGMTGMREVDRFVRPISTEKRASCHLTPGSSANRRALKENVDIGPKHLGRIDRGEKVPSFEVIITLAKELNASPSAFFHFENANVDPKFLTQQL